MFRLEDNSRHYSPVGRRAHWPLSEEIFALMPSHRPGMNGSDRLDDLGAGGTTAMPEPVGAPAVGPGLEPMRRRGRGPLVRVGVA
jgi:hypothetical protein